MKTFHEPTTVEIFIEFVLDVRNPDEFAAGHIPRYSVKDGFDMI